MKLSIVIPCYNSKGVLKKCLATVLKTKYPNLEIIVVDDFSTDGSYEYLLKSSPSRRNGCLRMTPFRRYGQSCHWKQVFPPAYQKVYI